MEEIKRRLDTVSWKVNVSETKQNLRQELIAPVREAIDVWARNFPSEPTYVQKNWYVPSALISVDITLNSKGHCEIYDIDETPHNVGIAYLINGQFKNNFDRLQKHWPEVAAVHHQGLEIPDDKLWIKTIINYEAPKDILVFPRNTKHNNCQPTFSDRSLAPIKYRGDKSYGEKMEYWKIIKKGDADNLPWDEGFVIKPVRGENLKNLEIFIPKHGIYKFYRGIGGLATETKIIHTINKEDVYVQKFMPPIYKAHDEFAVIKLYYGYNPATARYETLSGLQIRRKNLKIHGASDATFTPIIIS